MKITVFSKSSTNRLQYTLDVLLKQLFNLDFQVISDFEVFQQDSGPKINYSLNRISESEIFIPKHSLLFEKSIKEQKISVFKHLDFPAFFKVTIDNADLPFDIFAMTFYLLSRYEEYFPFKEDAFGRFPAKESLAFRNNFLQLPLVNLWAKKLAEILSSKFPGLVIQFPKYSFLPTYDIDHAWAFLHKGLIRAIGSSAKDLIKLDFENLKTRALVFSNVKKDPFFTFNYLGDLRKEFDLKPIYFFLLANWGKYDTNNSLSNTSFKNLIKEISKIYPVGIHPSFRSNSDSRLIEIEKKRLEKITKLSIKKSRQHFLILKFPETYHQLIEVGIQEDYSMGYAAQVGFRASIANSYFWYDLQNERTTNLKIHPFQLMDVTLNQYLKLEKEEIFETVSDIIHQCKSVGGTFTTLWHNSSLTEEKEWKDWRAIYEQIIKMAL